MFSSQVHLILSLSISYPYLIKFHDFAHNSQEQTKHHMTAAALRPNKRMTLRITLVLSSRFETISTPLPLPATSSVSCLLAHVFFDPACFWIKPSSMVVLHVFLILQKKRSNSRLAEELFVLFLCS